ncbi:MAG: amidohydrolase family protein [Clostridia bacterium]|nr:amidohydrolase family protein [Clostridia bacterium]
MTIRDYAFEGLPMPCPVIDAHTHMSEDYASGWHQKPDKITLESVISDYDRLGVNACVTAPHPIVQGRATYANELALEAAEKYPDRIYCYISVTPSEGMDAVKRAVSLYTRNPHFVGFKFLGGYNGHYLEKEYQYALGAANEAKCPVLCHKWGDSPMLTDFITNLKNFPDVKMICAHLGGGNRGETLRAAEVVNAYENFYLETCGSLYTTTDIQEVVGLVGAKKIIFGTDVLNLDPRYDFGRVAFSPISDEDKKDIFAGNYLRLLETSQMGKIKI